MVYPRPIAINGTAQDHGGEPVPAELRRVAKFKSRSAFSEERRKEVQLVRKMGACLRCRMLKKTVRIRYLGSVHHSLDVCTVLSRYTMFPVYKPSKSASLDGMLCQNPAYDTPRGLFPLHSILVYHAINDIKSQAQFELSTGRIEASHFEANPSYFVTFGTLSTQKQTLPNLDSQLPITVHDAELGLHHQDIHILDGETEELSEKLDDYMKRMSNRFYENEKCVFVKETLLLAADLAKTNQDELLTGVLDLWVATSILVGPLLPWKLFLNPTLPPASLHSLTSSSNGWRISIGEGGEFESYALICGQLKAAVEKRAAKTSKAVLNRIEQRLLQKQRDGNFQTFLASVILLNCVERMSWLFYSWEHGEYSNKVCCPLQIYFI
ncbi:predicted protein [Uncinocarpus reesii 1704]|uniref:Uncharacterized protein n=1 Tax=Uncinocarpus reesii (strain UAMH 1704) TaxID=336963 RepID=C4JQT0_UNCRE|nr:uncharacterized protein UREG_03412 [Uncinocarpus reesii 1704]EEP78566.1 predicted protein [Uncinocarpus reesii 1704]